MQVLWKQSPSSSGELTVATGVMHPRYRDDDRSSWTSHVSGADGRLRAGLFLNLGGNTDIIIRPKLLKLGAFFFIQMKYLEV